MKIAVILLVGVLAMPLLAANAPHSSAACPPDRTRVHAISAAGFSNSFRAVTMPAPVLLDDDALLVSGTVKRSPDHPDGNALLRQPGIRFTENLGQIAGSDGRVRGDIHYVANAPGARLYFRDNGISYVFTSLSSRAQREIPSLEAPALLSRAQRGISELEEFSHSAEPGIRNDNVELYRLDMTLVGSSPFVRIRAEGELPGYINYYYPHCPDGITGVKEYSRIVYENVYENVDLELFSVNGRMKYNFVVRPGGDPRAIRMQYDGATETAITGEGACAVVTPIGRIQEQAPYSFAGEEGNEVSSRFIQEGNEVSFSVDAYDRSRTLVIDPWATYHGGNGDDYAYGVAVDAGGNVFVAGGTNSTNFPVTPGAFQTSSSPNGDAFVAKFDANGTRLWATYYGGNQTEEAASISTDVGGNVVIGGTTTSSNFPVTSGAFQTAAGGNHDAFIVKFSAGGTRLWATYFGGSKDDIGKGVGADTNGDVVLAGFTASTNLPVPPGAFQPIKGKGKGRDAFVAKFSSSGARMWATYFGGKEDDVTRAMAVSGTDIFFSGDTGGSFPVTPGAFQTTFAGGFYSGYSYVDAFLVKMAGNGTRQWATYYGGNDREGGCALATDGSGNVAMVGFTYSSDFPVSPGAFQTTRSGATDAFVVKFNGSGGRAWGTYYGGSGGETAWGAATDGDGYVIVSGYTYSTDFPVSAGALQSSFAGGTFDAMAVKLDAGGARRWATYYGGSGSDGTYGDVATDGNGNVIFCTRSASTDFPTYNPFQASNAGSGDAVLITLNSNGLFAKRSSEHVERPSTVVLGQNYPNPFNPSTTISFTLPNDASIRLRVFDINGRIITELLTGALNAGLYHVLFDAADLPAGIYLYRLETEGVILSRMMTVLN